MNEAIFTAGGVVGPPGPQGDPGPPGPSGTSTDTFPYFFSTNTIDPPPSKSVELNNTDPTQATLFWTSRQNADGMIAISSPDLPQMTR